MVKLQLRFCAPAMVLAGAAMMFLPAAAYAQAMCPAGTVAYWPLDGNAIDQVNGIAGVPMGNTTFEPAQVGQGASMDGSAGTFIQALTVSPGDTAWSGFGGTAMSFTAWVKPGVDPQNGSPEPGNDLSAAVITGRTQCDLGAWQFYNNLGGPGDVYYSKWLPNPEDLDILGLPSETQVGSPVLLPFGTWSHVAITFDGVLTHIYVDGAEQFVSGPNPLPPFINDASKNVQLGWDSCSSYFTGTLDEIAVYDRVLSASEVSAQYAQGLAGTSICVADSDMDGVPDDQDVCPGTTGEPLADGCDCDQILDLKPGNGGRCNAGTLNVFTNRVGWAKNVPLPGGGQ